MTLSKFITLLVVDTCVAPCIRSIYKQKSELALVARHSILDIKSETSGLSTHQSMRAIDQVLDLELCTSW